MGWWVAIGLVAWVWAQRIVSRTQIEVKGYAVEKVGLPQSPAPAGKGRFAFLEYWAADKPKPGYYIECLNTEYYTQWSQPIDVPPAGSEKPLRLIGLRDAVVVLSYDQDPLTRGVIQEVARFYDLKGTPILPKWTPLSVYDRPASEAIARTALSPDSTYLLWYAYTPPRKNSPPQGWYALWSSGARKVASQADWPLEGPVLSAYPDNRANLWFLHQPPNRPLELVYEDTKARTRRTWSLTADTLLVSPWLWVTAKAVYVGALVPAEKNLPTLEGPAVGGWIVGRLPLPLTDSSTIQWSRASFPTDWLTLYKEPIHPLPILMLAQGDSAFYVIYEDQRSRGGTYLAYDVWACRWKIADSLTLQWNYRIEKRQREPYPDAVSFLWGMQETFLAIAFLTERTGRGKLRAYLLNHETGEALTKDLAENTAGDLLLLPGRSVHLSPRDVVCLAFAPPGKNGYQIYHLRF